jgi:hypothetical protein
MLIAFSIARDPLSAMSDYVKVNVDELRRVFDLVEKVHDFMDQPLNYKNISDFAEANYLEIKEVYYDILWNWLPDNVKNEIEER